MDSVDLRCKCQIKEDSLMSNALDSSKLGIACQKWIVCIETSESAKQNSGCMAWFSHDKCCHKIRPLFSWDMEKWIGYHEKTNCYLEITQQLTCSLVKTVMKYIIQIFSCSWIPYYLMLGGRKCKMNFAFSSTTLLPVPVRPGFLLWNICNNVLQENLLTFKV